MFGPYFFLPKYHKKISLNAAPSTPKKQIVQIFEVCMGGVGLVLVAFDHCCWMHAVSDVVTTTLKSQH